MKWKIFERAWTVCEVKVVPCPFGFGKWCATALIYVWINFFKGGACLLSLVAFPSPTLTKSDTHFTACLTEGSMLSYHDYDCRRFKEIFSWCLIHQAIWVNLRKKRTPSGICSDQYLPSSSQYSPRSQFTLKSRFSSSNIWRIGG